MTFPTLKEKRDQFIDTYDKNKNLNFDTLKYRGTVNTSKFGLNNGFRKVDGKLVWDTVRIHTGDDHDDTWNGKKHIKNQIFAPFDFNRSEFNDYGPKHPYGSLTRLFNDDYEFEIRIAHIHPDEILQDVKNKKPIKRNTVIGKAGTYGSASTGAHTHTEVVSYREINPLLHRILFEKYGRKVFSELTEKEIIDFYKKFDFHKNQEDKEIIKYYTEHKQERRAKFVNNYFYTYKDWFYNWNYVSRYSISKLFNV